MAILNGNLFLRCNVCSDQVTIKTLKLNFKLCSVDNYNSPSIVRENQSFDRCNIPMVETVDRERFFGLVR
jgi:hypothetical protein